MDRRRMEELMMVPYEELCDMAMKGEISWSEWIDLQGNDYAGYDEWLAEVGAERSDKAALQYISICEGNMKEVFVSEEVQQHQNVVNKYLNLMQSIKEIE